MTSNFPPISSLAANAPELVQSEHVSRTIAIAANSSWNLLNFRLDIIKALLAEGFRVVALAPTDSHTAALVRAGVTHVQVEFRSAEISPLRNATLFLKYLRVLRAHRPDAFLGFTIKPNIYGSLAARILGIPTINNVSGLGTAFIKRGLITRIAAALYREAFRDSSTVFFQNRDDQEEFISQKLLSRRQARLLPGSGVDLQRFRPTPSSPNQPFTFLLIARLLWDKGLQEYVDAARLVKERHPKTKFQILGFANVDNRTAVPREALDQWVHEGLIDYLGASDDVRPFIAAAHCIVLPSYREGLPRSLLEASAMARPIVGTDVSGVRDAVDDGVTGLLCAVRSADALAAAMLTMIALPISERAAMGRAGRDKVERGFAVEEVTRRYLAAIDAALPEPRPSIRSMLGSAPGRDSAAEDLSGPHGII